MTEASLQPPALAAVNPPRRLRRILCLQDLEEAARRHLPPSIFAYVVSPANDGASMRDNRAVFDEIRFVPRVLRNVSRRSLATRVMGEVWSAPFGIAPMGVSALTAYRGDEVLAESAAHAGIPMIMSGSSLTPMETVARLAPRTWFQAYLPPTPERIAALVGRAAAAGFRTLVVTVDVAVRGSTEHYERAGFSSPLRPHPRLLWAGLSRPRWTFGTMLRTLLTRGMPHFENSDSERRVPVIARTVAREFSGRAHLDWDAVRAIRAQWNGRFVLKGVLHPEDALTARAEGVDGIVLSNHGGRQLDGAVSPLRMLPAVRALVGDGYPVMIDSGFRRGTDVAKALALGADFVFVGRPFNYAASIAGQAGVAHAAAILSQEIDAALGMLGLNSPADLSSAVLMLQPGSFHGLPTAG